MSGDYGQYASFFVDEDHRIRDPSDRDVLCGRGKGNDNHPGNKAYQALIKENLDDYLATNKHQVKKDICLAIVATIRNKKGRFLEADSTGRYFEDIGDQKAIEKIKQGFRDGKRLRGKCQEEKTAEPTPPTEAQVNQVNNKEKTSRAHKADRKKEPTSPTVLGQHEFCREEKKPEPRRLPPDTDFSKTAEIHQDHKTSEAGTYPDDCARQKEHLGDTDLTSKPSESMYTEASMAMSTNTTSNIDTTISMMSSGIQGMSITSGDLDVVNQGTASKFPAASGSHNNKENRGRSDMSLEDSSRKSHSSLSGKYFDDLLKEPIHSDLISAESQMNTKEHG